MIKIITLSSFYSFTFKILNTILQYIHKVAISRVIFKWNVPKVELLLFFKLQDLQILFIFI